MKSLLNFILLIAFIVSLQSCAQNEAEEIPFNATSTKEYYANGKLKKEYYTLPDDEKKYNYREYYENGKLSIEYKLDENKLYFYSNTGEIEQIAITKNGTKIDALSTYYNYPKKIKSKIVYDEDKIIESYWYYPNGKIKEQRANIYHTGEIHSYIKFDENGSVQTSESRYLNAHFIDENHKSLFVELKGKVPCDSLTVYFLSSFNQEDSDTLDVIGFKSNKVNLKLKDDYWQDRLHIKFEILHFVDATHVEIEDFYLQLDKDEIPKKYNIDAIKK